MPVWLVGRQIQDRCSLVLNVGCSPHLWLVIVTQSPATLLKDCSPKWVTVSCRLACAGGTVIPRFQQNDCDQHSDAPREGNKASLPLVPPLNIRMVCAFLFLNLSFFFSLLNLFQMWAQTNFHSRHVSEEWGCLNGLPFNKLISAHVFNSLKKR